MIDKQTAIEIISDIDTFCAGWRDNAINQIKISDTIDAVPVVRCKDCRHYHKATISYCDVNVGIWFADDFCSFGRKAKR